MYECPETNKLMGSRIRQLEMTEKLSSPSSMSEQNFATYEEEDKGRQRQMKKNFGKRQNG